MNKRYIIRVNKAEAIALGKKRQEGHILHCNSSERFYDDPNKEDIIGVLGELAFEKMYGIPMDRRIRPHGDGHVDFIIYVKGIRITIDVKTANKPGNLLIKEWEIQKASDVNILAGYRDDSVEFFGWETREKMMIRPIKDFGYRIRNYYKPRSELRPMSDIDRLVAMRDPSYDYAV